jgi:hypothetical protein
VLDPYPAIQRVHLKGGAIMVTDELLDARPQNHPPPPKLLALLKDGATGLAANQRHGGL